MSDMGDDFREWKLQKKERLAKEGIDCPGCKEKEPKRIPTRLLPGWTFRVCGYRRMK